MAAVGSVDGSVCKRTKTEPWFTASWSCPAQMKGKPGKECGPPAHVIKATQTAASMVKPHLSVAQVLRGVVMLVLSYGHKSPKVAPLLVGWFRLLGSQLGLRCNSILTRIPHARFQRSCAVWPAETLTTGRRRRACTCASTGWEQSGPPPEGQLTSDLYRLPTPP